MSKISEGNWSVGRTGTVVTDKTPSWFKGTSGHDDNGYYGGFLIAESVANEADAKVMAAAPDMANALLAARAIFQGMGIDESHRIVGEQYSIIHKAIIKAGV